MLRMKPRVMDRKPGKGPFPVLLADRSTSMSVTALRKTDEAMPQFLSITPGLRVFAFHANMIEVDYSKMTLTEISGARGKWKYDTGYRNRTHLGLCLEQIAALEPPKTIVLCDGGVADKQLALTVADYMTGSIDAYFCHAIRSEWEDMAFMQELARRGRGRFLMYDPLEVDIAHEYRRSMTDLPSRELLSAPKPRDSKMVKRLPDHILEDDEFEFDRPDDVEIDLRRRVTLLRGTIFTERHMAPEWLKDGEAVRQRIAVAPPNITVNEPQGLIRKALAALFSVPQAQDRGQLHEAPQAIPAPSRQQSAVPLLAAPQPAPRLPALVPVLSGQGAPILRKGGR